MEICHRYKENGHAFSYSVCFINVVTFWLRNKIQLLQNCGKIMTEFLVASRDCDNNLELQFWHICFFFPKRAFLTAVPYLTLLNLDAFQALKLERRSWPLWCTWLFVERKSYFFMFLRSQCAVSDWLMLITAVQLWIERRYGWLCPPGKMFALRPIAWDSWHILTSRWWNHGNTCALFYYQFSYFLSLGKYKELCLHYRSLSCFKFPPMINMSKSIFFFKCTSSLLRFSDALQGTGRSSQLS